jgi:hypothetical protein
VHHVPLVYLAELGVTSEEEARARARELQEDIRRSLRRRSFVDASRFRQLCRLWQLRCHEPSTRRLAVLLKERLSRWGLPANIKHLQKIINGESPRVRYAFLEAIEDVLRGESRDLPNVERELLRNEQRLADLRWVPAQPIAALGREWLGAHPGVSQRQLARRVWETLARMGYSSSSSTIQPILGGRRKKTRGFVHRALLELWNARAARSPSRPSLRWREFLRRAREYLASARSPHLVPLLAVRAERLYGIPRVKAEARILERKWSPGHAHGAKPRSVLDGLPVEWIVGGRQRAVRMERRRYPGRLDGEAIG